MKEIWKWIPGWEDFYKVSNLGKIRSKKRSGTSGKEIYQGIDDKGYRRVSLWKNNKMHLLCVHKLVLKAFIGEREIGHVARHLNGVKTDNRIKNLKWGTFSQNLFDNYKHNPGLRVLRSKQLRDKNGYWTKKSI